MGPMLMGPFFVIVGTAMRFGTSLLGPATTVERAFANPSFPGGTDTDLYIAVEHFAEVFAADVPDDRSRLLAFTQRPLSLSALTGVAAARPAWPER